MTTDTTTPWSEALMRKAQQLESQFAQRMVALPDGTQLAVRERPAAGSAAQTVVLLHGISSSAASWLDVALALRPDWRVLAWDAPGYGASTALPQTHPRDTDYAAETSELSKNQILQQAGTAILAQANQLPQAVLSLLQ